MSAKVTSLVLTVLAACAAFGQTPAQPPAERSFAFTYIQTPQGWQEVLNAVRSIAEVRHASIDLPAKSVVVRGTAEELDFAEWVFRELDVPPAQQLVTHEYRVPGAADDVVHAFGLGGPWTPQQIQETVNAVRSILGLQRVVVSSTSHVLVTRAEVGRVAAADWMVTALSGGTFNSSLREFRMIGLAGREAQENLIRLLPVETPVPPVQMQEAVNAIRSLTDLQRVVSVLKPGVIAMRGTSEQIAFADWLGDRLLKPVGEGGKSMYNGSAVRVIPIKPAQSVVDIVNLVRSTGLQRVVGCNGPRVVAFRGTDALVAEAERLIQERDVANATGGSSTHPIVLARPIH